MSNSLNDIAFNFGVQAFKDGKKRIAAHDEEFLQTCLKDCKVGEGIPFVISWLKGWDDANLSKDNVMKKEGIKIEGHKGTWYIINESYYKGRKVFLLESEQYGEDAAALIVDKNLRIIQEGVFNGFNDLVS